MSLCRDVSCHCHIRTDSGLLISREAIIASVVISSASDVHHTGGIADEDSDVSWLFVLI